MIVLCLFQIWDSSAHLSLKTRPKLSFVSRAIVMMFIHLSVRLSVCLSGTGAHCDHTVHFSADLSSRLDSPMFWAP